MSTAIPALGRSVRPLDFDPAGAWIDVLDQTRLPFETVVSRLTTASQVAQAICSMVVRGAPLIGASAAWGLAFALREDPSDHALQAAARQLAATRPTAVNLRWALDRVVAAVLPLPFDQRRVAACREAGAICLEDVEQNRRIGAHGLELLSALHTRLGRTVRILTHCNAGWLATMAWGTALAPIHQAAAAGIPVEVWVDETRPRNQGTLTAWELMQAGIAHTLIVDNAGGHLMQHGEVDLVLVGADRVTADGDVCNKIGTYLKALAAHDCGVPFYAAVPSPTVDWRIRDGLREIPIEERASDEVAQVRGQDSKSRPGAVRITPEGTRCGNPAFDVTPARLVTGIVTEHGCFAASADGLSQLAARLRHANVGGRPD